MKEIRGVFVNVNDGTIIEKTLKTEEENFLEEYYKLLQCRTIDIVSRRIDGVYYNVVCDDEGLLNDEWKPGMATVYEGNIKEFLAGNLFVVLSDTSGNLKSLNDEDVRRIYQQRAILENKETAEKYLVLIGEF